MSERERKVLVIPGDRTAETDLMRLLLPLLVPFQCGAELSTEGYGVTAVVERRRFDLVVVGFPIEEPPLPGLLKSMRWQQSAADPCLACRRRIDWLKRMLTSTD